MRSSTLLLLAASAAGTTLLSGCVDPKHSRFANQGACEVSIGSRVCTNGPSDSNITDGSDPALYHPVGRLPGS